MTKRGMPSAAQQKYLEAVKNAPLMRFVQPAAWVTIRACELAGWTRVDGHGETRLSHLGRHALEAARASKGTV